ncbi:MAG: response regulator transcription factor [Flavobacteriales bacterium]
MVLIHAHWEVRMGLRQLMEATGTGRIVLELDGVDRVRSNWPTDVVRVVVLHVGSEVAPVVELIRWLLRRPDPPAVLAVGELTPLLAARMADAGAQALVHIGTVKEEYLKAVQLLSLGGIFPNGLWRAQRVAPRTGKNGGAAKGKFVIPERQLQVLRLLCDPADLDYTAIGDRLGISKNTVRAHVKELYKLFGVHARHGLVRAAITGGYAGGRPC